MSTLGNAGFFTQFKNIANKNILCQMTKTGGNLKNFFGISIPEKRFNLKV